MFTERLAMLPVELAAFNPAWPFENNVNWSSLPATYRERLSQTALSCPATWPTLNASTYLDFTRNGNRARYETPYMQRRRMLNAFALATLLLQQDQYFDSIIDGIMLLCEETGWQLPAHNTYVRDTPCQALPDPDRPVIDLFAAETGAQLALLFYLFGDRFDRASPLISARIKSELQKRIIEPYLSEHFWWMGNGDEPMCNWTPWCTQNILLVAFLTPQTEATRKAIITKAAYSLDCFLKDYGQDGACEEGILYYRHAGLCLFNALNILAQVAPEAFTPLWQEEKIRNIAEFAAHMHVTEDCYFNFADSAAKAGFCGAREYLFGKATGSAFLADFALANWQEDPNPDLPDEINLFYRLQTAFTLANTPTEKSIKPQIPDHFYESIGLLTARDDQFSLAVKAGDNGDSHNHNDVGSFTLYKNDKPFLIDIGVETYTAKTFSARRYEIWTMQSGYHNLPSFEGIDQQDGESFGASDTKVSLGEDITSMSMEIASAYPPQAGVKSYCRTLRFTKNHSIEIQDHYEGAKKATLSLLFSTKPTLAADRIILKDLGEILVEGAAAPTLETIPIDDPRLRLSWPTVLYRLLLPLKNGTLRLTINE